VLHPVKSIAKHPTRIIAVFIPNWVINTTSFSLILWIAYTSLSIVVNHLESNKAERWKHPIEHTNPIEQ
jgi:hypothetical protein